MQLKQLIILKDILNSWMIFLNLQIQVMFANLQQIIANQDQILIFSPCITAIFKIGSVKQG
jgi:hypothetical protein